MAGIQSRNQEWKFALEDRVIGFSSNILDLLESLPDDRQSQHIANQLLRSGTSVAPNYAEALSAESRRDFIHKLGISLKELREAFVWLKLIKKRNLSSNQTLVDHCMDECNQLISILVTSVNTTKRRFTTIRNSNFDHRSSHSRDELR